MAGENGDQERGERHQIIADPAPNEESEQHAKQRKQCNLITGHRIPDRMAGGQREGGEVFRLLRLQGLGSRLRIGWRVVLKILFDCCVHAHEQLLIGCVHTIPGGDERRLMWVVEEDLTRCDNVLGK
jgi:hypothetical protein